MTSKRARTDDADARSTERSAVDRVVAWLLEPAWPPLVALVAATVVFFGVLRSSGGVGTLKEMFVTPPVGLAIMPSAYAVSAASGLALATLLTVGILGVLADALARVVMTRLVRRDTADRD